MAKFSHTISNRSRKHDISRRPGIERRFWFIFVVISMLAILAAIEAMRMTSRLRERNEDAPAETAPDDAPGKPAV